MKKIFTMIIGVMAFCSAMAIVDKAVLVDVNCDGNITTADAQLIYDYILGTADDDVTLAQVDVNCDGNITTADAQLIYSYILGTADDSLTTEQVDINGDGKVDTADVVEVYVAMKKGLKGSAPDSDDTEFGY